MKEGEIADRSLAMLLAEVTFGEGVSSLSGSLFERLGPIPH